MVILSVAIITGSVLLMIPEMPELDMTQATMEHERMGPTGPHNAGGSTGMFLEKLMFLFSYESY
jgi:hypothetical protein